MDPLRSGPTQKSGIPSTRRRHPAERQTPAPLTHTRLPQLSAHERQVALTEEQRAKQKYEEITEPANRTMELEELSFDVAYQSMAEALMLGDGLRLIFQDTNPLTHQIIEKTHKNIESLILSKIQKPSGPSF